MATEVKQRNNRVFVLVGAVLALAAFGLSLFISRSGSGGNTNTAVQTVQVVVAKTDIAQGTQLTPDLLTTAPYPVDSAPSGAVTDATAVAGKYLSVGVTRNTPIQAGLIIADKTLATTATLTQQPLSIPAGEVALAIPTALADSARAADLMSVGYYIHQDDRIDILVDPGNGSVRYAFQDVRVLQVGDYGSQSGTPTTLIVSLPRAQAEQLAFLVAKFPQLNANAGIVKYVLRSRSDYNKGYFDTGSPNIPQKNDPGVTVQSFDALFPAR